jgi:hypothetical protein
MFKYLIFKRLFIWFCLKINSLKIRYFDLKLKIKNFKLFLLCKARDHEVLAILSDSYSPLEGMFLRITHPSASIPINRDRSTCMPKARRQRSS